MMLYPLFRSMGVGLKLTVIITRHFFYRMYQYTKYCNARPNISNQLYAAHTRDVNFLRTVVHTFYRSSKLVFKKYNNDAISRLGLPITSWDSKYPTSKGSENCLLKVFTEHQIISISDDNRH